MDFFDFLKPKKVIKGYIGFYNLTDWWLHKLSDEERKIILIRYNSKGEKNPLTEIELYGTSQTIISYLSSMYTTLADVKFLLEKIEKKLYESFDESDNRMILDMHFFYQTKIGFSLKDKENNLYLDELIASCNKQINFAKKAANAFKKEYKKQPLPSHVGYWRLAVILEKEKKYEDSIKICKQALSQEWAGDWEHRIERCQKKIEKQV